MEEDRARSESSDSDEEAWEAELQRLAASGMDATSSSQPVELDALPCLPSELENLVEGFACPAGELSASIAPLRDSTCTTPTKDGYGPVQIDASPGMPRELGAAGDKAKNYGEPCSPGNESPSADCKTLGEAISTGDPAEVVDFLGDMDEAEAREELRKSCRMCGDAEGGGALVKEARKGNLPLLLAVLNELWQRCSVQEILESVLDDATMSRVERYLRALRISELSWDTPSVPSQLSKVGAMITAVHVAVEGRIGTVIEVVLPQLAADASFAPSQVESLVMNVMEHVLHALGGALLETDVEDSSLGNAAVTARTTHEQLVKDLDTVLAIAISALPAAKLETVFRRSFRVAMSAMGRLSGTKRVSSRLALAIVSTVFKNGGNPSWKDLIRIGWANARGVYTVEMLEDCFLGAVESAKNPFIPGVTLSIALDDAMRGAPEGFRRTLTTLQGGIDDLLLEILERLPQTVRGFPSGLAGCRELFEPETMGSLPRGFAGPLRSLLQSEKHMRTFCSCPLVMDYLSRKFTRGLPYPSDSEGIITDKYALSYLKSEGLVIESSGPLAGMLRGPLLQGTAEDPNLTYLVGAQFTIAGVIANPSKYYKVPWLRMLWDLVVYIILLVIFSNFVLLYTPGPLTPAEVALALYILAALTTELRELSSGVRIYGRDRWNVLDLLALVLLTAGLVCRIASKDSSWGRGFYALSAPVVVSRILFFVQLFRFQGPMVQVIFAMTTELSRFAVVMVVVVFGFVMALHALLLETGVSYGDAWEGVFSAMLGDTDIFDFFEPGQQHSRVGNALLVLYFVITNIMLLNLLIGLLTTEYERIREEIDVEYRMSKARVIEHYGSIVEKDWLPAPFNLVQLFLCLPFAIVDACFGSQTHGAAREAVGVALFWLVSGVIAVPLGCLLWIISAPNAVHSRVERRTKPVTDGASHALHRHGADGAVTVMVQVLKCLPWYLFGAPLCLCLFWLRGGVVTITGVETWLKSDDAWGYDEVSGSIYSNSQEDTPHPQDVSVAQILKRARGMTVNKLRRYLEDPMIDPEVREDEKSREVTVEHLKLLRNRLEDKIGRPLSEEIGATLRSIDESLRGLVAEEGRRYERLVRVERKLEDILARLPAAVREVEE